MSDARHLANGGGWWQNHADALLRACERMDGVVPAHEAAWMVVRDDVGSAADEEVTLGAMPHAAIILSAKFVPDAEYKTGTGVLYLLDKGTVGTLNTTMYRYTIGSTITALRPTAFSTASATLSIAAGAGISLKRTTETGGTCPVAVAIQYVEDIGSQNAVLGMTEGGRVTIKRVTVIPATTFTSGEIALMNIGTAGTAATTMASKTGAALTGSVPYTLGLSTVAGATIAPDRSVLALKRTTASVGTMPIMAVTVEYALTDTE